MQPALGLVSMTLLGLIAVAPAAEDLGGFVDMRLTYKTTSTRYHVEFAAVDADENWETAHRVELNWLGSLGLRRWGGVIWGLGGVWWYNSGELPDGTDASFQTWTVQGQLGYGLPLIADRLQLEILPYVGFGRSHLQLPDGDSGADAYWEVGGNANLVWTFASGLQLGGTASIWTYETSIENEAGQNFRFKDELPVAVGVFIGARL